MVEVTHDIKEQEQQLWKLLEEVKDPEIPVLSIIDLGIVRDIKLSLDDNNEPKGTITITPTYSGCPAMDVIRIEIKMVLLQHGLTGIDIRQQLSPAWTTDWMTEKGKDQLKAYGIAPPSIKAEVQCPNCNSYNTTLLSQFGSTACKALYKCNDCLEPFDYFKCH
jgi:ring-1,2-phenylacetyl-CoA epoxidase subunit PaaD